MKKSSKTSALALLVVVACLLGTIACAQFSNTFVDYHGSKGTIPPFQISPMYDAQLADFQMFTAPNETSAFIDYVNNVVASPLPLVLEQFAPP